MFPLFETICVLDGTILHPQWHERRYEDSYLTYFKKSPSKSLLGDITVPGNFKEGKIKLRIAYNQHTVEVNWSPYKTIEIKRLKVIPEDAIEYSLKYNNRNALNTLYLKKEHCDDILILKEGRLTDSSYGNLAFLRENIWYTPDQPLLSGTCRDRLIHENKLIPKSIQLSDLNQFSSFKVINAMRSLEDVTASPIKNIIL